MTGIIASLPVPFPIRPDNACNNWGLNCPLQNEIENGFNIWMPIRRAYPRIPLVVQFQLLNEKSKKLICTRFPVRIQDANYTEPVVTQTNNPTLISNEVSGSNAEQQGVTLISSNVDGVSTQSSSTSSSTGASV